MENVYPFKAMHMVCCLVPKLCIVSQTVSFPSFAAHVYLQDNQILPLNPDSVRRPEVPALLDFGGL